MLKKVIMYIDPKDSHCGEIKDYLQKHEILLQIRDIKDRPLEQPEISLLLRHFELAHFLNPESRLYKKNKLDISTPVREEVYNMIASDNNLLRIPIIVYGRLMTVGCNIDKITEMLQLKNNGSNLSDDENPRPSHTDHRKGRR
jgi:arsenate reductase-like glutaredoxin family protein